MVKPKAELTISTPKTCTITGLDSTSQGETETILRQTRDNRGREMGCALSPKVYPGSIRAFPHVSSLRIRNKWLQIPTSYAVNPCPWKTPCSSAQATRGRRVSKDKALTSPGWSGQMAKTLLRNQNPNFCQGFTTSGVDCL